LAVEREKIGVRPNLRFKKDFIPAAQRPCFGHIHLKIGRKNSATMRVKSL
jgi:hypothetical protein